MKQILLSIVAIAIATTLSGQDCTQLFFSEYVEGTGNNKALEIYNPTQTEVSLNDYQLARYDNGAVTPNYVSFPAGTTIAARSVLVVVLDKRDPNGVDQEVPVAPELQAKADIFLCPVYNINKMMYFNGDDAVTLERKSNGAILDIIGRIGEDPGYGWNNNTANECFQTEYNDPNHWTYNNTMVRKESVKQGVSENPTQFNPSIQWDTVGVNNFDNLRKHNCDCGSTTINSLYTQPTIIIYPNPSNGETVCFQASKNISKIEIYNTIGQVVVINTFDSSMAKVSVDVRNLNHGIYVAKIVYADNTATTRKLQVK